MISPIKPEAPPSRSDSITTDSPITYEVAEFAKDFFGKTTQDQTTAKTLDQLVIKGLKWNSFTKICSAIKNFFCHGTFKDSATLLFESIKTPEQSVPPASLRNF